MYRFHDIRQLHLEITTACNASCPLCLRNVLGGKVNPALPEAELTLKDVQAIFSASLIRQLDLMYLCGNYGDPMVARETLEILEHFRRENPQIRLGIHTNGSGRSPKWWARLAGVVDYCRFGIDGLEDTNHLYRRGTRWGKVMESVTAFIAAGGRAEWDFIVFRHNEHQVEAAREASRRLGFASFFTKNTYRFLDPNRGSRVGQIAVLDRDGNFEYFVQEPASSGFLNESLVRLGREVDSPVSYQNYLYHTQITCKVDHGRKLYVSAEGLAFPCCWTANLYPWYQPRSRNGVWQLLDRLPEGRGSIDAKRRSLQEIVDGPFFQQMIPESWERPSLAAGKLEVCSRTCGTFDLYAAQYAASAAQAGSSEPLTRGRES
jgi:MoaA/NifB/PqqE/SkfB family radical SAM enzyme